jgi:hypothetical protein
MRIRPFVPNVVFPTGVDPHAKGTVDVYCGMAGSRIGVARFTLPAALAEGAGLPKRSLTSASAGPPTDI